MSKRRLVNKKKLLNKWQPLIDSLNVSDDKKDWLTNYAELQNNAFSNLGIPQSYFSTSGPYSSGGTINNDFVPLKRITAQTVGLDLVAVKPMEINMKPAKSDKQKLRESRINKIRQLEGEEPNVVLPDDIKIPDVGLLYIDYQYPNSSGNTQNNI